MTPQTASTLDNVRIADVFDEMADLLEIKDDGNPYRIRAYRNGASVIRGHGRPLRALVEDGQDLTKIHGIGEELAKKIAEILATGTCSARERLRAEFPPAILALLRTPGLGPSGCASCATRSRSAASTGSVMQSFPAGFARFPASAARSSSRSSLASTPLSARRIGAIRAIRSGFTVRGE